MKFKTFEKIVNECKEYLQALESKEKTLERLFGQGDNFLKSEYLFVDKMLDIALEDLKADEWVYDLLWDVINDNVESFDIDGAYYDATIENIWMLCKGKLDERYATKFVIPEPKIKKDSIDDILRDLKLDIEKILENYLFEINDIVTHIKILGEMKEIIANEFVSTKRINDFKVDIQGEGNSLVMYVSIQVYPGTEGYTAKFILG